jgi:DMSO/TMAO reductase YedYZ molybdopterin-dependent catalytic subunit
MSIEEQRRAFLKNSLGATAMAATASMPFWSTLALAQNEELVPFTDMPEGFQAPPVTPGSVHFLDTRTLDTFYTPNDDFYIVQHYNQPVIPDNEYSLRITGLIDKPLTLRPVSTGLQLVKLWKVESLCNNVVVTVCTESQPN